MAHVAKYSVGACGHMCAHYERARKSNGEYVKFGNDDIHPERTGENYNLAPDRGMSQVEFIRKRCSEVKCMKRKDVNVMCSWVVTMPKDLDRSRTKEFMQGVYDFLSEKYGAENVVSAYVHLDEAQPHMHFAFVPVVKGKVCAKELLTRDALKKFHPEMQDYLEQRMHCSVKVRNDATQEYNKSIKELKGETAKQKLQQLDKLVKLHEKYVDDLETFGGQFRKVMSEREKELMKAKLERHHDRIDNAQKSIISIER